MLDLILDTARRDDRIRAVILNGSRADPRAPHDIFQDYDVVYVVTDVKALSHEPRWIDRFGEMMILQTPDDMGAAPARDDGSYAYLMQFADGNRIDLTLFPVAQLAKLGKDSQTVVLLDKDSLLPTYPLPSDLDYVPGPPSQKDYADCCNEFWWVCSYVAKGLWRRQITYAKAMYDEAVREQLMKMLAWYVGVKTDFRSGPGKLGKHLEQCLEPELWAQLLRTYADADTDRTWDALLAMGDLFRTVAVPVAEHFAYEYPHGDDWRVSAHLRHVRALPADAKEIY
jgi:aminoglycoside 6-adenylyltransferase